MPLVQSLDILRRRITNPMFKGVLDDVFERVRAGSALRKRSRRTGNFPGVYTASLLAGEKSGNLERCSAEYVSYVKVVSERSTEDDLGTGHPRHSASCCRSVVVTIIVVKRRCRNSANFYNQFGHETCRGQRG